MPYGSNVFEVYPQSLENMAENLTTSPAPWLNLATRGLSHNHSWTEVMRMTSQSKCSDARDSLYGVLGLWASGGRQFAHPKLRNFPPAHDDRHVRLASDP